MQGGSAQPPGSLAERLGSAIEQTIVALDTEAAALASGSPETLLEAVAAKRRALQHLETLSRDPRVPMLLHPRSSPETAKALNDKLQRCRTLNLATGGAIVSARRDNDQALKLLGHEAVPPAYEAQGHSNARLPSRTLGRA